MSMVLVTCAKPFYNIALSHSTQLREVLGEGAPLGFILQVSFKSWPPRPFNNTTRARSVGGVPTSHSKLWPFNDTFYI
ncbi:hypothetical protein ACQJBY_036726 [Aegilops geniculata]